MRVHTGRWLVVVAVLGMLGGCASSPRDRSEAALDGLTTVRTEMEKGLAQLDRTVLALDDLATNPQADLTKQYQHFVKQVDALDDAAEKARSRNQSLQTRAQAYFESWKKDTEGMKSEALRGVSAERAATARASFDRMVAEVQRGKEAFVPLMDELRDIEVYLANDLTPGGMTAVRPIVDAAKGHAATVKETLTKVMADLARVESELAPRLQ
jgi:hypothetical protein